MDQTKRAREISIRFFARLSSVRRCFRDLSRTSEAPSCWASKRGSSLLLTVKTRKGVVAVEADLKNSVCCYREEKKTFVPLSALLRVFMILDVPVKQKEGSALHG